MKSVTLAHFLLSAGLLFGLQVSRSHPIQHPNPVPSPESSLLVTDGEAVIDATRNKVQSILEDLEKAQSNLDPHHDSNPPTVLPDVSPLPPEESAQPEALPPEDPIWFHGNPAPVTAEAVDASYYADAAIIGDSRSQGLMAWGELGGGANYTGLGLSVYNLWDKAYIETPGGNLTVFQALARGEQFSKIYIALGINSVGYPSQETFYDKYTKMIQEIRSLQPQALIYVQSIIPVNEGIMKNRGTYDVFNNAVIRDFNRMIQRIASEQQLVYLDTYTYFLDSSFQLPAAASSDGLHLNRDYCKKWADYLRWHTVEALA